MWKFWEVFELSLVSEIVHACINWPKPVLVNYQDITNNSPRVHIKSELIVLPPNYKTKNVLTLESVKD
jgi:hypothetical protein